MKQVYGYVRVSTKEQNEERQMIVMRKLQISESHIYMDKQSGKDFKRPAYQRLLRRMKEGDVLYIQSIDRLGRNYAEILEQWAVITKEKKADVVVLDMPILDTRAQGQELIGTFISDLVLQILSYIAETEREFIKKRQAEGIAAAKQRGVRFGVNPKELPEEFDSVKKQWENGELSVRMAAKKLGIPPTTFYRKCTEK